MPASSTATIDRGQRDGLYELVRNHLGGIGDIWIALEENEDFATAERLGLEFGEDFRLLEDIGWATCENCESLALTMPIQRSNGTAPAPARSDQRGDRPPAPPLSGCRGDEAPALNLSQDRLGTDFRSP
jgi:hypothetical protein